MTSNKDDFEPCWNEVLIAKTEIASSNETSDGDATEFRQVEGSTRVSCT